MGASSPLVRQAMSPPIQDYSTLAAARKHCEPLLKATPTVRLQATRDKQNSTQPSSLTPDSVHLAVGTTQWSAPRSPQNEVTTRNRSALVTTTTSAPSVPAVDQIGQLLNAAGAGRGNLRARTARSRGFDRHRLTRSGSWVFHQQAGRLASTDRGPGRRSCGLNTHPSAAT